MVSAGRTRSVIFLSMLVAVCPTALALNPSLDISQYAHSSWTIRDGTFVGVPEAIAQTADGYLWVGTEFGLLRFDGIRLTSWQPPNSHAPIGYVNYLLAARDGRLWIGTRTGLASWKDGNFTSYAELSGQAVNGILEDREGTVWVSSGGQPSGRLCEMRGADVRCYGEDGSLGRAVNGLAEYEGGIWATTTTGVWRWKPGPPRQYALPGIFYNDTREYDGRMIVATDKGLLQLRGDKLEPYSIPDVGTNFYAGRLLKDHDGSLWIGTAERGLLHVHQDRADSFGQADGLSDNDVTFLFEDREGDIWVATREGLDRFRGVSVFTVSIKQGVPSRVGSLLSDRAGSIWLGTVDGLGRWNEGEVTVFGRRDGVPGSAQSLFQDEDGGIWATTFSGVARFEQGRFSPVTGVPGGYVWSMAGTAADLWISSVDQGLMHLKEGKLAERIPWTAIGPQGFASVLLRDSPNNGLWLGFLQGGMVYFKDGKVQARYGKSEGLGEGRATHLRFDSDGAIWAATAGGLSRIQNGRIQTMTDANGLPCDSVNWTMEDDHRFLWMYTACGLVRVARAEVEAWVSNPKYTVKPLVLDASDGVELHSVPVSGYSPPVTKAPDGKLWFVGVGGASVIDPRHLLINNIPPPVQIEEVIADRQRYQASPGLRLPPLVRDLEIDYTALSLADARKNRFRVQLEGRDPDWKDMGNDRKAFYNDLPPRHYRFRVKASNNSGVWNEAGASFDFSIDPKYYQTTWFKALCAATVLTGLWGLYRLRLHQIAREFNLRLEERVSERTRLARDLHDTLLQSFHGLMLRFQVVDKLLPEGKAKDQLEKALEQADEAIAEGRSAVYDLRSSTITTNDLSEALNAVGNELSKESSAEFGLVVEGESRDLHPIVRDEIYRISREALRNAFKHAHASHIEAEINYGDRLFRLRVRDDGEGIPAEILEEGRPGHYGLPGMRERAKQAGGDLTIWSRLGGGTEIDLSLAGSIAYATSPRRSRLRVFGKKVG